MPYKDKVYGAVAGRTGLNPKSARLAVEATIEIMKTKMPPVLGRAIDTMMESEGGNILWEFAAPGAGGDKVNLAASAVESTAVKAIEEKAKVEAAVVAKTEEAKAVTGEAKTFGSKLKGLFGLK